MSLSNTLNPALAIQQFLSEINLVFHYPGHEKKYRKSLCPGGCRSRLSNSRRKQQMVHTKHVQSNLFRSSLAFSSKVIHLCMRSLFIASHCLNGIEPLNCGANKRFAGEGSGGVSTLNACGPGAEVQYKVGRSIVVHIPNVPFVVRLQGSFRAEANALRINGSGVKGLRTQDSDPDQPIALGIDTVGKAGGPDLDLNFRGCTKPRANTKE
jgi:hypothetical protein